MLEEVLLRFLCNVSRIHKVVSPGFANQRGKTSAVVSDFRRSGVTRLSLSPAIYKSPQLRIDRMSYVYVTE